jgi:predicted acyltransferase (DUF342 family)
MSISKFSFLRHLALAGILAVPAVASASDETDKAMSENVFSRSIFASTYVTLSASTTVYGDVTAGAAATLGADTNVWGSMEAGAATTLGADVGVWGNVYSGAATTLGATSWVDGLVESGAATTIGAGATINERQLDDGGDFYATPDTATQQMIVDAQAALDDLSDAAISSTIAADMTVAPGVYRFAGPATVSAGTTIWLDADGMSNAEFIFNSSDYVTFGDSVNVVVINGENASVIWNVTGTYISVGANANIPGTLLAASYVSTGANSTISGGAFSATSYVAIGAGATVGAE